MTAIALTIAVSSVIALGLGAVSLAMSSSNRGELTQMHQKLEQQIRSLRVIEENQQNYEDIARNLEKQIRSLEVEVRHNKQQITQLKSVIVRASHSISALIANLEIIAHQMRLIVRSWKAKELNPVLFDVLNITLPCTDECPPNLAYYMECHHDPDTRRIRFIFSLRRTVKQAEVMIAEPFDLIDYNRTTGEICRLQYTGPTHVVYDHPTGCVTPVHAYRPGEKEDLLILPDIHDCSPSPVNSTLDSWQKHDCEFRSTPVDSELIQIKPLANHNYIYCPGLNILVFGRNLSCPNFPFVLDASEAFQIGRFKYTVDKNKIRSKVKFLPAISDKINFHLMPELHDFDFSKTLEQLKQEYRVLSSQIKPVSLWSTDSFSFYHLTLFVILVSLLAFLSRIIIIHLKNSYQNNNLTREIHPELTELTPSTSAEKSTTTSERPSRGVSKGFFLLGLILCLIPLVRPNPLTSPEIHIVEIAYDDLCIHIREAIARQR